MWEVFSINPSEYFSHSGAAHNKFIINELNNVNSPNSRYLVWALLKSKLQNDERRKIYYIVELGRGA